MTKSITNTALLVLHSLAIGTCLSSAPAMAASDTATFAANTPSAKRLLEEFANATSLGKACGYREEAIGQYYSKEFARLIRQEAKGPTADQDVDREVGIALVSVKMFANQRTEGRRFTGILKEVTTRTVADFLKRYDGKERMAQAMRSLLLDIFREAIAAGWCERNPVQVTRAERVETKRQRLSLDQFMAIHTKAKEQGPIWLVHFLELALLSGQRRGDLAKMRYKDMKDGCLNVIQQKNKKADAVGHKVAIPLELQIAGFSLQATIASTRNVVSQYLVHHIKQAGRAKVGNKIREHTIAEEFAAIREEVGIVGDNPPTIHEIRSLSARLYKDKYGEEFAQALLGHKSAKMAALYQDERDGWFRPKIAS